MSRAPARTVEELAARLRSPRQVTRAADLDPSTEMAQMTVFRGRPDGGCDTWLREDGVDFHHQEFDSEAAAVADAEGRLTGTAPQPGSRRHLSGPPARTVEELKDAAAELGRDPDGYARAEVLRDSPQFEGVLVFETTEAGVTTYLLERGSHTGTTTFPDEATAVAERYLRLVERYDGDVVDDVRVEQMRIRARRFRDLMDGRAGR